MPTDDDQMVDNDETLVIFSFTIQSSRAIDGLAELRVFEGANGKPLAEDNLFYEIGHASFEDGNWRTRADKLDSAVRAMLDRLDATGVQPDELRAPEVFVKAFFTFGEGDETISAEIVERLARYHATIWIDA